MAVAPDREGDPFSIGCPSGCSKELIPRRGEERSALSIFQNPEGAPIKIVPNKNNPAPVGRNVGVLRAQSFRQPMKRPLLDIKPIKITVRGEVSKDLHLREDDRFPVR